MRRRRWPEALLLALGLLGAPQARADVERTPEIERLRVMGGAAVGRGEFPSMISVQRRGATAGSTRAHLCGGTTIAPHWVLTAAHCVVDIENGHRTDVPAAALVVAEGREDHRQLRPDLVRLIEVERILVHERYDTVMARLPSGVPSLIAAPHDIALLQLREPSARPRQLLAGGGDRATLEAPGRAATVIGFGQVIHGGPASETLLRGSIPVVPIEQCRAHRRALVPDIERLIGPSQLCAGFRGGTTDSCEGDSGGPLFVQAPAGRVAQIGVVSLGPPCRAPVAGYGTYTSVAALAAWIRERVPDADFTTTVGASAQVPDQRHPPQPCGGAMADSPALPREFCNAGQTESGIPPGLVGQVSIDIREGNRLQVGKPASFRVVSSVDGVLFVFARDPAGQLVQLFPNRRMAGFQAGQASPVIAPGQIVILPGPADGFRAVVRPPLGEAVVIAAVLPRSEASDRLARRHLDLAPIPDADGFLREVAVLASAARSLAPEALPTRLAIGFRRFTVVSAP